MMKKIIELINTPFPVHYVFWALSIIMILLVYGVVNLVT
tara:strand:+ start:720 stop:836 length:117 start_codon:yes stop_codon:yes gene_type:complete